MWVGLHLVTCGGTVVKGSRQTVQIGIISVIVADSQTLDTCEDDSVKLYYYISCCMTYKTFRELSLFSVSVDICSYAGRFMFCVYCAMNVKVSNNCRPNFSGQVSVELYMNVALIYVIPTSYNDMSAPKRELSGGQLIVLYVLRVCTWGVQAVRYPNFFLRNGSR